MTSAVSPAAAARLAVLGAVVGDAAALGLHWLYDQQRTVQVAGSTAPEFTAPNKDHYANVRAYFAHEGKPAGDISAYSELVLLQYEHLQRNAGELRVAQLERSIFHAFKAEGGSFVGYRDSVVRGFLERYAATLKRVDEVLAEHVGADNVDAARSAIDAAVDAAADRASFVSAAALAAPDALASKVRSAAYALAPALFDGHGSPDDAQAVAWARVPAIVAFALARGVPVRTAVEAAMPVTHKAQLAVEASHLFAELLAHLIVSRPDGAAAPSVAPIDAVRGALQTRALAGSAAVTLAQSALDYNRSATVSEAVAHFGMPCKIEHALPSALFALLRSEFDFVTTSRADMLAGGDSCGRAMLYGAVAGVVTGVPADWVARLTPAVRERLTRAALL